MNSKAKILKLTLIIGVIIAIMLVVLGLGQKNNVLKLRRKIKKI